MGRSAADALRARPLEARMFQERRHELVDPTRSAKVWPAPVPVDEALRQLAVLRRVRELEAPRRHLAKPIGQRLPRRDLEVRPPWAIEVRVLADAAVLPE